MKYLLSWSLCALLLLFSAGCDSDSDVDDPDDLANGRANVQLTIGGDTETINDGFAYFFVDSEEDGGFGLIIIDRNINDFNTTQTGKIIVVASDVSQLPPTGTYTLLDAGGNTDTGYYGGYLDFAGTSGINVIGSSTGGTFRVTGSSNSNLSGTVNMTGETVTLSGTVGTFSLELSFNATSNPGAVGIGGLGKALQ
ncbi:MAG: hypothetical protein AAF752_06820 [Bacteroidota bacterium]